MLRLGVAVAGVVLVFLAEFVYYATAQDGNKQGCQGARYGKWQSHEREGGYDGVYSRLWCGYQKGGYCTWRSSFFAQRHGCGYHATGTEGYGYAQEGGIEYATEGLARQVFVVKVVWHKGVHDTCQQEAQKQIGRHTIQQLEDFLHERGAMSDER